MSLELRRRRSSISSYSSPLIFCFIFFAQLVSAGELFETHSNARAMGMGGAFAAIVGDDEALWYNPAGLAKNSGFYWTVADPRAGVSGVDALTSLADLQDAATFATALDDLYGEPIWVSGGAKSVFQMPYFAIGYFMDVDASILADNPVAPTLTTNYITDTGYVMGSAFSIAGIFQMGFATKYITRKGLRQEWGTQTIADIVSGTSSPDVIFDGISDAVGTGYSLDMGINLTFPTVVQPTISFVWKDIGNTKFRSDNGVTAPPTEMQNMILGASMMIDLPLVHVAPAIEIRHLEEADGDVQLGKKIHVGVEVGIPFVDLRAGLYQGYYTLGLGLNLGLVKIDAATWGTELGGHPGQLEDRRYMVQAIINFGFDIGGGSGSGGSGSGGRGGSSASGSAGASSGGGGSSSSKGSFFKRKPKQRR